MTEETTPKPRFLIVRLSAIGDTIHSLPLAAALRKAFPEAYIGWVVEKPAAPFIENNPLIDWVKVLPKGWLKKPAEVARLRRELREQRFEVAFDPQGLTKSAAAALLSGAKRRVGFFRGEAREIAPVLDNELMRPVGRHVVDKTLSLIQAIGEPVPERGEFVLPPPSAEDRDRLDRYLEDEAFRNGFVLIAPWGSFQAKLWPLERFGAVAGRIYNNTGLPALMLGHGDAERSRVTVLADESEGAVRLAPAVEVTGVAELARRARLFVGCDSFPMHVAAAVGCPTVGLFGVDDPERVGPYGTRCRAVFENIRVVRSLRERRRLGPDIMLPLGVDKVADACLELLAAN